MTYPSKRPLAAAAALLLLALVYLPALRNGFVDYDDPTYVVRNPHIVRGLTLDGVSWSLTATYAGNWHPLTWISHMLDVSLFGMNPAGHHLTSVALHAGSAVLLLLALHAATGALGRSAAAAAIFLVHPLRVESVAWVAERKDVLCGFLFMLALLAYLRYARRPAAGPYLLVALLFLFGLMAKPMLVTFPFVLLLLDWWPLGRLRPGSVGRPNPAVLLVEKAPLFALSIASALVTLTVQRAEGALALGAVYPLSVRIANALTAYASYLGKAFYPAHLASFYPHLGPDLPLSRIVLSAALLATASAAALLLRGRPYLLVGWLWFLGMLVPVIGIVQVGLQALADRYTYLPLVGIGIAAVWGVADVARRLPRRRVVLAAAATLVVAALAVKTSAQVGVWKDTETLLANDLKVFVGRGSSAGAPTGATSIRELERIAALRPGDPSAQYNLGLGLAAAGMRAAAKARYRAAIALDPGRADAHNNLGQLLAQEGQLDAAVAEFKTAVALLPENTEALYNLGTAYDALGLTAAAIGEYRAVLAIDPGHALASNNLGVDLALLGDHDEAIAMFQRALSISPDLAEARFNLVKSQARRVRESTPQGASVPPRAR